MRRPLATLSSALLLGAAIAACSSSTTSSSSVSDDVIATDVAYASAPELGNTYFAYYNYFGVPIAVNRIPTSPPISARLVAATRRPSALTTAFSCAPNTTTGTRTFPTATQTDTTAYTHTWEFFDSEGCQDALDDNTDSVVFTSSTTSAFNDSDQGWTKHATGDLSATLSGGGGATLHAATTHVWNSTASGNGTTVHTGTNQTRTYTGSAVDTGTAVTFNHPLGSELFPTSGTLSRWGNSTLNVTGNVTETKSVALHILVTFDGTGTPKLEVFNATSGTLIVTCTLDLVARRATTGSCHT
ncbi:MAG TPA: hypothetical protein VEI06_15375 [Gemmatimonadaceae bacterium]|nr:hypothetical protein [Gemmatimonadaceae bacterium]